jgi:hypothetical protein
VVVVSYVNIYSIYVTRRYSTIRTAWELSTNMDIVT